MGRAVEFIDRLPWPERERRFWAGAIDVCWICGLPYVRESDRMRRVEIAAAPVPAAERYGDAPVYFSDVVVRADSPFRRFADLHGAVWAYNEPASHSGHNVVRYEMARRGLDSDFFGRVLESGAHQTSLDLILAGVADASAIDSTVLETESMRRPGLASQVRIIDTFGPSPIPPWVFSPAVAPGLRREIRAVLLAMSEDAEGAEVLAAGAMRRFQAVDDASYEAIRAMARYADTPQPPPRSGAAWDTVLSHHLY
jgi:phosphonate transport system substrate-binding protein